MKKWLLVLCALLPLSTFADEIVRKPVKVGGYVWFPFVELQGRNYQGLTLDLIDAANAIQGDYQFEFVLTTPGERHNEFYHKKFDMIFFEDIDWGWNAYPINASLPLAKGTELYIALNETGRTQRFFQDLPQKSISVLSGLHYSFTGLHTDEAYLREHFKITLRDSPEQILQDVLTGKTEIGVISNLSLQNALKHDPKLQAKILVANKVDQDFTLSILARKDGAMSIEQVNIMIERLKKEGILQKLLEKYQITSGIK